MPFETFDLAKVVAQAEGLKQMRREGENDVIRQRFLSQQLSNAQQAGKFAQSAEEREQGRYEREVNAKTARSHHLAADAVVRAADPVKAAHLYAPEFITDFEAQHGEGSFESLTPDQVREMAEGIKVRSGAHAGISPPIQVQTVQGPRGALLQRDPLTGKMDQVIAPDNSQPVPSYSNVQLDDGSIGAFNNRTGQVVPTGQKGKPGQNSDFRNTMSLRKEFDNQQVVKDYRQVVTSYQRALNAPDTRAGDLSIVYAMGKIFDPNSVVREGELKLSQGAAPWLAQVVSQANSQITGKGALTPDTRKALTDAMRGQVDSVGEQYDQIRSQYSGYAKDMGAGDEQVVGTHPFPRESPRESQGAKAEATQAAPTATGPNGARLILRNGRWEPFNG